jgi:RNA polymerase sigma-70 factor (ECF subfamily)
MERALLEAFRRGDREALERVYSSHVRHVEERVRAVLNRLGKLTAADLADLVQDAFLQAFSERARGQYDGERDYGPFVIAIARNIVIDWIRRSGREVPMADLLGWFAEEPAVETESEAFDSVLLANTRAYIDGLAPNLQEVHRVRFVLGMPQRQAAAAMGISRQSLRTLEKKLLSGFRRHLHKSDGETGRRLSDDLPSNDTHRDTGEGGIAIAQRR